MICTIDHTDLGMTTERVALLADRYIGRNGEQPAIKLSIQRMACTACGAEANASCNCGQPYKPVSQRVNDYDKAKRHDLPKLFLILHIDQFPGDSIGRGANPGTSTRKAAADLGVSKSQ